MGDPKITVTHITDDEDDGGEFLKVLEAHDRGRGKGGKLDELLNRAKAKVAAGGKVPGLEPEKIKAIGAAIKEILGEDYDAFIEKKYGAVPHKEAASAKATLEAWCKPVAVAAGDWVERTEEGVVKYDGPVTSKGEMAVVVEVYPEYTDMKGDGACNGVIALTTHTKVVERRFVDLRFYKKVV